MYHKLGRTVPKIRLHRGYALFYGTVHNFSQTSKFVWPHNALVQTPCLLRGHPEGFSAFLDFECFDFREQRGTVQHYRIAQGAVPVKWMSYGNSLLKR